MMQDHRDQSRVHAKACRLQCSGIPDDSPDMQDATLPLEALQVCEGFGRAVDGINHALGSDPISEHQAYITGPRAYVQPEIDDALKRYGKGLLPVIEQSLRAKPGLTGPWQVSGRNTIPWEKRVEMDADYAKRRSMLYDFCIMLKTPLAMISKW